MVIDQTKVQQQVVKNLFLNNRIAVFLRNLSGNNQHEVSDDRMETSQPNSKGIYAINVAPPANGFLLIKGNRIQNATQGIHLLNTKGAKIAQDSVFIRYKIPGGFPNCGVLAESCEQTSTNKCTILAPNSQTDGDCSYGCEGIRFDLSNNSKIACNHIVNSCDALVMLGSQTRSTTLTNNIMQESFRGIYLGAVRLGTQGQPNFPQDNQWIGNFAYHLYTDGFLGYRDTFFFREPSSPASTYYPYPFINGGTVASSVFPIVTTGMAPACPIIPPFNLQNMLTGADQGFATEAANPYTTNSDPNPMEKLGKEAVYKYMQDDTTLVLTPSQLNFKDSMALEDLGKIADISQYLVYPIDAVAYALATAKTQALMPIEVMEDLYKEVITMALSDNWLYKQLFTVAQTQRLRQIAAYCPFEWGRGVYAARVLLSYVDEPYKEYYADCEQPALPEGKLRPADANMPNQKTGLSPIGNSPGTGLFPNPNQGNFTLNLPNPELAALVIEDVLGHVVYTGTVKGSTQLNLQGVLAKGYYTCRVLKAGKTSSIYKMIVQP